MKSKQSFDVLHAHDGLSKAVTLASAVAGILFVRSRILALKMRRRR